MLRPVLFIFIMLFNGSLLLHPLVNGVRNGADIRFPEDPHHLNGDRDINSGLRHKPSYKRETNPIPFFQKISNYTVSDLLINYVDDYEDDPILINRFGEDERSPAITPKPATCMPELTTIRLIETSDPAVVYLPTCTRIERCGGCCSHNLLACQPTDTETISFKVVKTQFTAGNRLKYVGKEIVHIEKHNKCRCGCKIKDSDCNRFQEYRQAECRCVCTNKDAEAKCEGDEKKLWDPDTCSCRCREILTCSTGFQYDTNQCKCSPILVRRRFAEVKYKDEFQQDVEDGIHETRYFDAPYP